MSQEIGKRQSPRLKAWSQYLGGGKIASVTPLRWEMSEENHDFHEYENCVAALYVHATIDPATHLTLNNRISLLPTTTLVDSGATGVFMHPDFSQECNAQIRLKSIPREVRVINGRIINLGLITHEATVDLIVGDHREILVAAILVFLAPLGWPAMIPPFGGPRRRCYSNRPIVNICIYCGGHKSAHQRMLRQHQRPKLKKQVKLQAN